MALCAYAYKYGAGIRTNLCQLLYIPWKLSLCAQGLPSSLHEIIKDLDNYEAGGNSETDFFARVQYEQQQHPDRWQLSLSLFCAGAHRERSGS